MAASRVTADRFLLITLRRSRVSYLRDSVKVNVQQRKHLRRMLSVSCQQCCAVADPAIPIPRKDGEAKIYSEKIRNIVEEVSKLTLAEVVDLNSLLKETLGIQDAQMMPMAGVFAAQAPAQGAEAEPVKEEQTEFAIKLVKFDDGSKVKLIKEIKALLPEMNLVQAKKFVESAPKVVKEKLSKEDSEKIKKQLESVGATVEVE